MRLAGGHPLETHPYPVEVKNRAVRRAELLEVRPEAQGKSPDLTRDQREFNQPDAPGNRTPMPVRSQDSRRPSLAGQVTGELGNHSRHPALG